tara:strand:- start:2914 stop:4005 length:1092 start_codon:yes stop_codon:yes gene_type:complete
MTNTPKTIISYLIKEFSNNLLIFFFIFLSLIILLTFIQELVFFRNQDLGKNFYIRVFLLSVVQVPSLIITMSPFIILFTSVFFYTKLISNNETTPVKLSGLSNNFLMIIPSLYSMIIGIVLVLILSPFSSELSKYYESTKRSYAKNENLIVMSNTGMWLKEKSDQNIFIIRADVTDEKNLNNLKNINIYKFDLSNKFEQRIDAESAEIKKGNWYLKNTQITTNVLQKFEANYTYPSNIDLDEIKNFFINSQVFSIWNINRELKKIRERGYYGQEIIITLNKYLSLPFFLFAITSLSTVFTLKMNVRFSNFSYIFICIILGILIYFLADLSIALGKSGKIPLSISVWFPVIIVMTIPIYSLLNE